MGIDESEYSKLGFRRRSHTLKQQKPLANTSNQDESDFNYEEPPRRNYRRRSSLKGLGEKILQRLFRSHKRSSSMISIFDGVGVGGDDDESKPELRHEIIGCEELLAAPEDNERRSESYVSHRRSSTTSTTSSSTSASFVHSTSHGATAASQGCDTVQYNNTIDLRRCTNCAKCFQLRFSVYHDFCGLDCKTAFTFRKSHP